MWCRNKIYSRRAFLKQDICLKWVLRWKGEKLAIQYSLRATSNEKTQENTRVSFRVRLSRDFSRLPEMESLLAGLSQHTKQLNHHANNWPWKKRKTERCVQQIHLLCSNFHKKCSRCQQIKEIFTRSIEYFKSLMKTINTNNVIKS